MRDFPGHETASCRRYPGQPGTERDHFPGHLARGGRCAPCARPAVGAEEGGGFTTDALFRMVRFVECFPDPKIVATLSPKLGWSHIVELIVVEDPLGSGSIRNYGNM
ncbi:MAG: hypothetical protein HY815_21090 [Candidatus Riflebacteria bacterium]|nr:hypothetical protein [Candidatus Riflebacteria bacterium]